MGIHFYKNALHGGDWILQERLGNCEWLSRLLPEAAPLSTMRIITSSTHPLSKGAGPLNDAEQLSVPSEALGKLAQRHISPLTAVLRLGRANAATDHSSVLFDVDMATGRIGNGLDNSHWYKLGLRNARTCPWLPNQKTHTKHPDPPYVQVLGQVVPDIKLAVDICVQYVLCTIDLVFIFKLRLL